MAGQNPSAGLPHSQKWTNVIWNAIPNVGSPRMIYILCITVILICVIYVYWSII